MILWGHSLLANLRKYADSMVCHVTCSIHTWHDAAISWQSVYTQNRCRKAQSKPLRTCTLLTIRTQFWCPLLYQILRRAWYGKKFFPIWSCQHHILHLIRFNFSIVMFLCHFWFQLHQRQCIALFLRNWVSALRYGTYWVCLQEQRLQQGPAELSYTQK